MFNHRAICERAIKHWGAEKQMRKAVEECLELGLALHHHLDGRATLEQVIDEVADVEIMCDQLRCILGQVLVDYQKEKKLERLDARLDGLSGPMDRRREFLRELGCSEPYFTFEH